MKRRKAQLLLAVWCRLVPEVKLVHVTVLAKGVTLKSVSHCLVGDPALVLCSAFGPNNW
jgi:hypothetical protein